MRRSPTGTATGATPSAASARRAATRPAANSATRAGTASRDRGGLDPVQVVDRGRRRSRSPTSSWPAAARRTHGQSGGRHRRTLAVMADWMLDELAHAGQEHLDEAYVAGYEAKSQYDPAPDVTVLLEHGLDRHVDGRRPRRRHRRVLRSPSPRTAGRVVAVDVSPAMVDVIRRRVAAQRTRQRRRRARRLPHLRARRRCAGVRVQPQRAAPGARLLEGHRPRPRRPPARARRRPASARPRVRLRARRRPGAHRRLARRRRRRSGASAGRPTSSPSTCASSTARTAGCSSPSSNAPASTSSSGAYVRGAYGHVHVSSPVTPHRPGTPPLPPRELPTPRLPLGRSRLARALAGVLAIEASCSKRHEVRERVPPTAVTRDLGGRFDIVPRSAAHGPGRRQTWMTAH